MNLRLAQSAVLLERTHGGSSRIGSIFAVLSKWNGWRIAERSLRCCIVGERSWFVVEEVSRRQGVSVSLIIGEYL